MWLFGKKRKKPSQGKKTKKKRKNHSNDIEHNFDEEFTDDEFFEIMDD